MKILNPESVARYTALRKTVRKISRMVPSVGLLEQPPRADRDTASAALEFPTPMVILNSTMRESPSLLFSRCDTVQTDKTDHGVCFTFSVSGPWLTAEDAEH